MLQNAMLSRSAVHPPSASPSSNMLSPAAHAAATAGPLPFSSDGHAEVEALIEIFLDRAASTELLSAALAASLEVEKERGERWKMLAVSLTALASLEKRWGKASERSKRPMSLTSSKPKPLNHDGIFKNVEHSLYLLARAKSDAFTSSLTSLAGALEAFQADLLMVPSAAEQYKEARALLEKEVCMWAAKNNAERRGGGVPVPRQLHLIVQSATRVKITLLLLCSFFLFLFLPCLFIFHFSL